MKSLALIFLFAMAGCSRAQWQETPGDRALAQQNEPKPTNPSPQPTHRPPQTFAECQSQTLSLEVDISKSQDGLRDFKATSARYPQMKLTMAAKTKKKVTFFMNALDAKGHSCDDSTCAEAAGWSQIQDEILELKGMNLQCNGQPAPFEATSFSTENGNSSF